MPPPLRRVVRPGRIDRKIEFPLPDVKTKRMIFKIHTARSERGQRVAGKKSLEKGAHVWVHVQMCLFCSVAGA